MKYPGTIGVRRKRSARLWPTSARVFASTGSHIVLIGTWPDQEGLERFGRALEEGPAARPVHYIAEYYDDEVLAPGWRSRAQAVGRGCTTTSSWRPADVVDPTRAHEGADRAGKFRINGVDCAAEKTIEWGGRS
jgi:hypothetical protein